MDNDTWSWPWKSCFWPLTFGEGGMHVFPALLLLYQHHVLRLPSYSLEEAMLCQQFKQLLSRSVTRCFFSLRSWGYCCKELHVSSKQGELHLEFTAVIWHWIFTLYFPYCSANWILCVTNRLRVQAAFALTLSLGTHFVLLGDVASSGWTLEVPTQCCCITAEYTELQFDWKRLSWLFSLASLSN